VTVRVLIDNLVGLLFVTGSENSAEQGKRVFKMEDNEEETC
jgi:hypothetical protein